MPILGPIVCWFRTKSVSRLLTQVQVEMLMSRLTRLVPTGALASAQSSPIIQIIPHQIPHRIIPHCPGARLALHRPSAGLHQIGGKNDLIVICGPAGALINHTAG